MTTPKHTPGPWKIDPPGKHRIGSGWCVLAPTKEGSGWPTPNATGFYHMAEPPPHGHHNKTEQEANARLIAAAPESHAANLKALSAIITAEQFEEIAPDTFTETKAALRAAIAKATGETP